MTMQMYLRCCVPPEVCFVYHEVSMYCSHISLLVYALECVCMCWFLCVGVGFVTERGLMIISHYSASTLISKDFLNFLTI